MDISDRLSSYTVGIAGCGGLGSNCAVALARIGIGKLVIADFDVVEPGNLNRQYFFLDQIGMKKVDALHQNISRINPGVSIEAHPVMLTDVNIPGIFGKCDVVVEAFDNKEMKLMLAERVLGSLPGTPLVMGSGLAGWGQNNRITTVGSGNLFVCGDESTEVSPDLPPLAPRVGIVAHMQANLVVEILLGGMKEGV
jgi:sulfur carrier protein ThiS adenylyltransferase